jgi:ABC-type bacteriocin/lantibiotic exporter with double-glycine peptidase domain
MTHTMPDHETLSATTVLHPTSGEVIECVAGAMLVFAQCSDGRRLPLLTLNPGECAFGSSATEEGERILLTGMPGTEVKRRSLDELVADGELQTLEQWISVLGTVARRDQWADKVVAPSTGESLRLAPGERVVFNPEMAAISDQSVQGWLKVTSGSAQWCGWKDASIGVLDTAIPMTRDVWLTAGLRCRISEGAPPNGVHEWSGALDMIGRLAIKSAIAFSNHEAAERASRLVGAEARSLLQVQEGIDLLSGTMSGSVARPRQQSGIESIALAVAFDTMLASGIPVDDAARERAQGEVDLGREPMTAVAESCMARARTVDLREGWWTVDGPAMVGRLKAGGPVRLSRQGRRWVMIDPSNPAEFTPVTQETAATLQPKATEFIPVLAAKTRGLRSLRTLSLMGSRADLVMIGVMTALIAVIAFAVPFVFGQLSASLTTISSSALLWGLSTLILVVAASIAFRFVRGLALLRVRVKASTISSGAIWDRMMRLRAGWHDNFTLGERVTQATAVNNAGVALPDMTISTLLDAVAVFGGLAAVATTGPVMLAAVTVLMAVQICVSWWLVRVGATRSAVRIAASASSSSRLMEILGAVNRLRVSGAEGRAYKRWAQRQAILTKADLGLRRLGTVQMVLIAAWPLVGLIVIVAVSTMTDATYGQFVTAQTAAVLASASIAAATVAGLATMNARAILDVLNPVLEAVPEGFGAGINPGVLKGDLSVRDVVFRYEPGGPAILNGVSFHVSPGEQVAIVGPSGCGKTTLMRILLGLEDPESGVITADGKDLASLDRPSLRRQIGCVLQSSTLLPGPLKLNVDMGRQFSTAEIWKALDAAAVGDDVRALGMGLDTPVNDSGGTLSGGQRQRVLIARALAGDPKMLILDEATSALDNVTQSAVVESIERLRLTRIVVAHRLSTIRNADRIIVLVAGKVAQEGTFDELMAVPGHFRDLALRQMT